MFIFDHINRSREIRKYTESFLFPRKVALDAARAAHGEEDRKKRLTQCEEKVAVWLEALHLYSGNLHASLMGEISLLVDHYKDLLAAEGYTYADLVSTVYESREGYRSFLRKLAGAEREVNEALKDKLGNTEHLRKRLEDERLQFERLREKDTDIIF
jgi:hypothetical protein